MSTLIKMVDDLLYPRKIIDPQFADVPASWSEVQKGYRNPSPRKLVNQPQTDLGRHNGHAANVVLHHSLGGFLRPSRIVVRIAENRVVAQLTGSRLKSLDHLRKERVHDVGHDDAQCTAVARSQMACVRVGE